MLISLFSFFFSFLETTPILIRKEGNFFLNSRITSLEITKCLFSMSVSLLLFFILVLFFIRQIKIKLNSISHDTCIFMKSAKIRFIPKEKKNYIFTSSYFFSSMNAAHGESSLLQPAFADAISGPIFALISYYNLLFQIMYVACHFFFNFFLSRILSNFNMNNLCYSL